MPENAEKWQKNVGDSRKEVVKAQKADLLNDEMEI